MLSNFHTHTTFCDGKNTAREVVLYAIDKGFDSIGFSGHGYTDFHLIYCMKETDRYCAEIKALKEEFKDKIQIYLGVEEDMWYYTNRADFDYIIGSCHYFNVNGEYWPIDSGPQYFKDCLERFNQDVVELSENYYSAFCDYILKRKPDIVGHFDLITKFDEMDKTLFLENEEYFAVAEKYMEKVAGSGVMFEVNTGAISRGYRTKPYPHERLLHILKKHDAKLVLSSDSHQVETLDFAFDDARQILRDAGFECVYALYDNEWKKDYLI